MPDIITVDEATTYRHTVDFGLVDETTGLGMTGEAANVTISIEIDGTTAAGQGSVSEVDSSLRPGVYRYSLHADERDAAGYAVLIPRLAGAVKAEYPFWISPNSPYSAGHTLAEIGASVDTYSTRVAGLPPDTEAELVRITENLEVVDTTADAIKSVTDLLPDAGALTTLMANVAAILNDTDATLDDKLDSLLTYVDTEVAAIKSKTDQLTFSKAGEVDVNVQSVNDVTLAGDGAGTPIGAA